MESELPTDTGEPVMGDNYAYLFSKRAHRLRASEIRELLKLTQKPEIISFAGGLPNPEVFPVEQVKEIACDVLNKNGKQALQYGTTEGLRELREEIAKWMGKKGVDLGRSDILITSGAQQGLDLISRIFLNVGDPIMAEAPLYLGAASCFNELCANIKTFPSDNDGVKVDLVEDYLKGLSPGEATPKLMYVDPTFQNPSGVTLSESRRKKLLDLANDYRFIIIEDDPYGELRFEGDHIKPIKAFDDEGRVVNLGTFSKLLAPGLRIAWVTAEEKILHKLIIGKQSADLASNTLGQCITAEFMKRGYLTEHVELIKKLYGGKRDLMMKAMKERMPEGVTWTHPEGGLFLWATMPHKIDTLEMLPKSLESNVAYVAGHSFYPDRSHKISMRINFSYPSDEKIIEGVSRLANVIEGEIKAKGH